MDQSNAAVHLKVGSDHGIHELGMLEEGQCSIDAGSPRHLFHSSHRLDRQHLGSAVLLECTYQGCWHGKFRGQGGCLQTCEYLCQQCGCLEHRIVAMDCWHSLVLYQSNLVDHLVLERRLVLVRGAQPERSALLQQRLYVVLRTHARGSCVLDLRAFWLKL